MRSRLLSGLALSGCLIVTLVAVDGGAGAATAGAGTGGFWVAPPDLEQRDLLRGPTEGPPPPVAKDSFAFVARHTTGSDSGYDVRDGDGVVWSVSVGPEAQAGVVASRLLWAIGFHQPPTYYLSSWSLSGPDAGPKDGGCFRLKSNAPATEPHWSPTELPIPAAAAHDRARVQQLMALFARLSDQQWQDAFRAGGYSPEDAARYIATLKARVAAGLAH